VEGVLHGRLDIHLLHVIVVCVGARVGDQGADRSEGALGLVPTKCVGGDACGRDDVGRGVIQDSAI